MAPHRVSGGVPRERKTSGDQLVQDAAERIEVVARFEQIAGDLVRRHVRRRAPESGQVCDLATVRSDPARKPEIEEDGSTVRAQEDIPGLQVRVDDSFAMQES